jgi:hypothetical protein
MRATPFLLAACAACDGQGASADSAARSTRSPDPRPGLALDRVGLDTLCVTSGELSTGAVEVPTFRAVALGHGGDAAAIRVRVRRDSAEQRPLDSGELRRQLGLKLRAQDSCNLVYVMWRLGPEPGVEVSIKLNPGARTSKECGARGYKNVKPQRRARVPSLASGDEHELRAEITGAALTAWIDDRVIWQGTLPAAAAALSGPAGVRSDNVALELLELRVDARAARDADTTCPADRAAE